ncbi:chaplin family protein [Streptomyces varsoviensis]|uniref:chaplin n=1 Tax=Streptomyces varsoviensis TaxID=67373 RepID=UPI00340ADB7A
MRQVARKGLITVAAASGVFAVTGGGYAQADAGAHGGASNSPGVLSGNSVQVPVHVPVNACGNTVNVIGVLNPTTGNKCANGSGGRHHGHDHGHSAKPGGNHGGAVAHGGTHNSPGIGSGNGFQVPIDVPVNACGNSANVVGLGNSTTGNECANPEGPGHQGPGHSPGGQRPHEPQHPGQPHTPDQPGHHPGQNPGHNPGHHPQNPGNSAAHTPPTGRAIPSDPDSNPGQPQASGVSRARDAAPSPHTVGTEELARTGVDQLGTVIPVGAGLLFGGAVLYRRARVARR